MMALWLEKLFPRCHTSSLMDDDDNDCFSYNNDGDDDNDCVSNNNDGDDEMDFLFLQWVAKVERR